MYSCTIIVSSNCCFIKSSFVKYEPWSRKVKKTNWTIWKCKSFLKKSVPVTYITSSTITEDIKPVVSEIKLVKRPYKDNDIKILQNFLIV